MWGQFCNQTIDSLSCAPTNSHNLAANSSVVMLYNQTMNIITCKNNFESSCHGDGEPKVYTLDVMGLAEELRITAKNISFNITPNKTGNVRDVSLMCIVRHGAMPSITLNDYSSDINKAPLVIRSPRIGRWYITFLPQNLSREFGGTEGSNIRVCYIVNSNVLQCPPGKAGPNCTLEKYILQVRLLQIDMFLLVESCLYGDKLFFLIFTLWPLFYNWIYAVYKESRDQIYVDIIEYAQRVYAPVDKCPEWPELPKFSLY